MILLKRISASLCLQTLLFAGAATERLSAAQPIWWTAPQTSIIDGAERNDFGPANLGQLKYVAKQAAQHLELSLPSGGAGLDVTSLVDSFQPGADDRAPINLGQLKAVAKPFYVRLLDSSVHFDTRASLRSHQASGEASWAWYYPWNTDTPIAAAENYAPASVGQLKWVFSFDLTNYDGDGHGLPDAWEMQYFGSTGYYASGDEDGDGSGNGDEYTAGTVPNKKDNPLVNLQVSVQLK